MERRTNSELNIFTHHREPNTFGRVVPKQLGATFFDDGYSCRQKPNGISTTPCQQCPLRDLPHFRDFSSSELDFVSRFKTGNLRWKAAPSS